MQDTKSNAASIITKILITLAIIGGLNWGLIGFFDYNLVDAIFGGGAREQTSAASRVVYSLVGLGSLIAAFLFPRMQMPDLGGRRLADRAT